jgi:hypothetical protein
VAVRHKPKSGFLTAPDFGKSDVLRNPGETPQLIELDVEKSGADTRAAVNDP